jgi:transcriptional regulator with XRE-family HTH domain
VESRLQREPRFREELASANAELALGEAIVHRRHERNLSLEQIADLTGIPMERLEAIEAGDSMSLPEVLWLVHVLDLSVSIGANFHVNAQAPRFMRRSAG